jgi:type IX secretion system PorP/SprF family membrane protein
MGGKVLLIFVLLVAWLGKADAQQLPQGGLYTLNPYVVNPALSGAFDFADVRFGYRRQWQGFDDAPNTAFLSVHSPIAYGNRVPVTARTPRYATTRPVAPPAGTWRWGAGAMLLADQTGPTERNIAQLTGAAHVSLPNEWQLSAGLGAGVLQYVLRFDRIQTSSPSDPILPGGRVSMVKPYFSAGMLARKGNFWTAASVLSPRPISLSYAVPAGEITSKIVPHYYLTASYRLAISEDWVAIPQVWVKKAGDAPVAADAQLRVQYADRLWGGVHYRVEDSMGALLGLSLTQNLTLSYLYEYPLSSLRVSTMGSHEIMIGFRFNNRAALFCPPMGW